MDAQRRCPTDADLPQLLACQTARVGHMVYIENGCLSRLRESDIFKLSRIYNLFAHRVRAHYIVVHPVYRAQDFLLSLGQPTPPAQRI